MPKTKKKTATKSTTSSKKQKLKVPTLTDEEKRVVMIQYEKENDSDGAQALLVEYLKFMQIKIGEQDTTDKKVAPSKKIDEMWHAHILSTKEYFAFCERYNDGEYIHHDPSMTDVPTRYTLTWRKYLELFGACPKNLSIWPQCELELEEDSGNEIYDDYDDFGCG